MSVDWYLCVVFMKWSGTNYVQINEQIATVVYKKQLETRQIYIGSGSSIDKFINTHTHTSAHAHARTHTHTHTHTHAHTHTHTHARTHTHTHTPVFYTHPRAHDTGRNPVCSPLLKKKTQQLQT